MPVLPNENTRKKTPLENHFIYLAKKEFTAYLRDAT
jgi:hypothetical protein